MHQLAGNWLAVLGKAKGLFSLSVQNHLRLPFWPWLGWWKGVKVERPKERRRKRNQKRKDPTALPFQNHWERETVPWAYTIRFVFGNRLARGIGSKKSTHPQNRRLCPSIYPHLTLTFSLLTPLLLSMEWANIFWHVADKRNLLIKTRSESRQREEIETLSESTKTPSPLSFHSL